MAASAILAGLLGQQTTYGCSDLARYLMFLAIGLALATAAATLLVLFPRTTSRVAGNLLYFEAIEGFESSADYFTRVQGMPAAEVDRGIAHQVWELSRTQDRKHHWLRWAFWLFAACLVAALVGVVWIHLSCG